MVFQQPAEQIKFLGQKYSLQMMIKIINFKILPYSSTLQNLAGSL